MLERLTGSDTNKLTVAKMQIEALRKQVVDAQATIADLQGQVSKWQEIAGLRFAGDHKFVKEMELLKVENSTLQQRVAQLEGERSKWEASCNLVEAVMERNKLKVELSTLQADHARVLQALVEVVPVAENLIDGLECDHDVGMCCCEDRSTIAEARASLPAQPAQGGEDEWITEKAGLEDGADVSAGKSDAAGEPRA